MKLSDQQYQILNALWILGSGTARDVQKHVSELGLAHTTVGTILTRLEKKGVLSSKLQGRERIFSPAVNEADIQRSMIGSLVSTLFKGDPKDLLVHLVKESDFEEKDLEAIRNLLNETPSKESKND